ncbi:unnamed protein product [Cylicocyclus nassatus]|uniref:C-type lectin domain-containing protein n=1 Tax=Cylicocyclus nassatus TaxID=53992 RepID=A0AA36M846_CYLNA|nr:unnamed protein product [Cylicocyclus nassatus]
MSKILITIFSRTLLRIQAACCYQVRSTLTSQEAVRCYKSASIMFLFFAWISLANAFINPTSNELISKSLNGNCGSPDLRCSNEACPGHCESTWTYFDKTEACYKTFFEANFYDAEYFCSTLGGHLISIHSYDENVFVAELARMGRPWSDARDLTWIGLRTEVTQSMKWNWTDGTKLDKLFWGRNRPINDKECDCVLMYSDPYVDVEYGYQYQKWTNNYCAMSVRSFVCKKTALH